MKRMIYYVVIVLLSVVLVISAEITVKTYLDYKKADDVYEDKKGAFFYCPLLLDLCNIRY